VTGPTKAFLDRELLDRFEARLRASGAAVVDGWAPGLTDDQIDALVRPIGIELPEEARAWWRWHNGVQPNTPPESWDVTPGRSLISLEETLELYVEQRDWTRDAGFPEALLSPVSRHPILFFQCDGECDAPVPIYVLDDWSDEAPRPALPSIGELVQTWISYIDMGLATTNADGSWRKDSRRYSQAHLDLGVY
jgi:SMI1 / KNR4 family (SUKH-1)